jgi:thioredoxin-like negative regulator of GroEL
LPRAYFEGLVARGRGDKDAAERAFAVATQMVETDMAQGLDDAKATALLGVLHALRGNKDEAVNAGRRAVELLPISKDAYDGPLMATKLAVIYAQVGEVDRAIEMLADLMKTPNGPTPGTLRVEPEWEPLRGDPRFEKLADTGV